MTSTSYKAFKRNISRSGHFISIHKETMEKPGRPPAKMNELSRAAVVFAVGALDAYISEASAEYLVRIMEESGAPKELRDILVRLNKELPALALEVVLMTTAGERKTRVYESVVDHFHNNVSNHGAKAVSRFVERIGRKPTEFWAEMDQYWEEPAGVLDFYTMVRHEIVHQGQSPQVNRAEAEVFIEMVADLVLTLDDWVVGKC
jgi:HEPN superfamily RiboL-PSP-like protein